MIKLNNLNKTFHTKDGIVEAVKNVTIEIEDKDIFGIIGFSGAGKSTLIRCLNLLERPDTGEVLINDVDLMKLNEKDLRNQRQKIGMIFQHFNLMRSRTVYDNINFPLKKTNMSKEEKNKKILSLLKLVGLEDRANSYPSQLSGGQKQRVAIARALANDPKVLLCDEATSALDPQTTKSILDLLQKVNEELGITIILITHEMAVIKDICNKVAIMENGIVVESGTTHQIFLKPKQKLTKTFIDTASNIGKIYDFIEMNHPLTEIDTNDKMVLLTYGSQSTHKSLISEISQDFNVQTNIIFGNIDLLKGGSIGKLVIICKGSASDIENALAFLKDNDVEIEVIK